MSQWCDDHTPPSRLETVLTTVAVIGLALLFWFPWGRL